ncbi:thioredoxin-like domain-containing protein [Xylariales sp. AK1849]|nr:thioredoxin-like domain-containing protein [Xylariales sp. AK1849]
MRTNIAEGLCLLATSTFVSGWNHLAEQDFRRVVGGHNKALVAFVEPSTAASQALESDWVTVSESEKITYSVNCASDAQLCKEYEIISYPTIRYFDGHGKMTPYRGSRTPSSVVSFIRRAGRPTLTILDEKKITAFQSVDDVVVVAHLNPRDTHIQAAFKSLAYRYTDQASFGTLETDAYSTVVCYNNRDDEQSTASDFTAIDTLASFVTACMAPLVGAFSRRNEIKYSQSGKSLVYYLATTREQREAYTDAIRPVAKKYKEFLSFVTVDANEYAPMTAVLGLRPDTFPAVAIENQAQQAVFPFTGQDISPETIESFVLEIAGGKVKPWSGTPSPEAHSAAQGTGHSHDEL